MTCDYNPRFVPEHQGLINCPKCHRQVVAGMFHLDYENPLTLEFVAHFATRPRVRFHTADYAADIAKLEEWISIKSDYFQCLMVGDTKLKPRERKRSSRQVKFDEL
jgi:hypothetical protein